jgi:hypothetical protein
LYFLFLSAHIMSSSLPSMYQIWNMWFLTWLTKRWNSPWGREGHSDWFRTGHMTLLQPVKDGKACASFPLELQSGRRWKWRCSSLLDTLRWKLEVANI